MGCVQRLAGHCTTSDTSESDWTGPCSLPAHVHGAQNLLYHGNCQKLGSTDYIIIKRNVVRLMLNCKLARASRLHRVREMSDITILVKNVKDLAAPYIHLSSEFTVAPQGSGHNLGTTDVIRSLPRDWNKRPPRFLLDLRSLIL